MTTRRMRNLWHMNKICINFQAQTLISNTLRSASLYVSGALCNLYARKMFVKLLKLLLAEPLPTALPVLLAHLLFSGCF